MTGYKVIPLVSQHCVNGWAGACVTQAYECWHIGMTQESLAKVVAPSSGPALSGRLSGCMWEDPLATCKWPLIPSGSAEFSPTIVYVQIGILLITL